MRRVRWLLCLLLAVVACGESGGGSAGEVALATYADGVDDAETLYVTGTLEVRGGCLAAAVTEDDETSHALLRLPSDDADGPEWTGGRLQFHGRSYDVGSELVFRATVSATPEVDDVPPSCRDADVVATVSATPEVVDLGLDPAATVLGSGAQPRVAVAELSNAGMDAAMRSELAVVGDRCLGVGDASGAGTLLIWPFGTTVLYGPEPVVTLPGGTTYAVGDVLDLGGGFVSEDDAPRPDPIEGLPDECQGLSRFLVSPY
ncbi:hypothetical protein IFT73_13365 [Aeromicrobium sp. CFBP 8757]|uniref:hypothetical protein n=1 Tax=Aeromicrobium sp. CFBP 8757 TaxID=2775288 RepID=UPI00177DBA88|nr:hypothetical protein [Aeromicrobium sp. CFBP 8757]MBD8607845.1 hypothetical protein [Aeromicrobium sp. CFBP 8757]